MSSDDDLVYHIHNDHVDAPVLPAGVPLRFLNRRLLQIGFADIFKLVDAFQNGDAEATYVLDLTHRYVHMVSLARQQVEMRCGACGTGLLPDPIACVYICGSPENTAGPPVQSIRLRMIALCAACEPLSEAEVLSKMVETLTRHGEMHEAGNA